MKLRDYQSGLIHELREAYRSGCRAPLAVAPTGAGKTVIFGHIARGVSSKGRRVMILVHRQELLDQTARTLREIDVPHGLIMSARTPDPGQLVQVASVQTLIRRLDRIPAPDLIVIDEGHHGTAGTWRKILEAFPNARVLGVTATPERLDGKGLGVEWGGIYDALVRGPEVADLVRRGFLSQPIYYAPPGVDMTGAAIRGGDYRREDSEARVDKPTITGDAVEHYRRICPGSPAIAFCASVKHAEHVAEAFRAAGFRAATLDGSLSDADRRERVRDLGSGRLHVMTSCEIVNEGFDVPVVTAAILLRPTASLGLHLQQIGRVLRPAPGKANAIILDHVGNCHRHGLAEEIREWSLDGAAARKRKAKEDAKPRWRQCPKCYAVSEPSPTCPQCGHEYIITSRDIEQVAGELVMLASVQQCADCEHVHDARDPSCPKCGHVHDPTRARKKEQGRAQTFEELVAVGKRRKYSNPYAWAKFVWRSRQARKPMVEAGQIARAS